MRAADRPALRLALYAAIALLPAMLLAPWFGVQFDRDEGAYAVVAMGLRDGHLPYRDLFDHKPPLIYAWYATSFVFGTGLWQPRVLAAVCLGATALLVALASRQLGVGDRRGYVAGALFGLSTSNLYLQMNANSEAFMLLPMVGSFAAFLAARGDSRRRITWWAVAGALAGAAVLTKTSAVMPAAFLLVAALVERRWTGAAALAASIAAVLAACGAAFALAGAWDDFWYANVTYNRLYTDAIQPAARIDGLLGLNKSVVAGGAIFWALAAVGVAWLAVSARDRKAAIALGWALACLAAVKFTGRDLAHYYVQLLPAAALLSAAGIACMAAAARRHRRWLVAYVALLPLAAFHALLYGGWVHSSSNRAEIHSLHDYFHVCEGGAPEIGAWLRAHSARSDRVLNYGRDTEIYFYAQRMPSHRFMYSRPFELDPPTTREALRALRDHPPRYIVDTRATCDVTVYPPEFDVVLRDEYAPAAEVGYATIYERPAPTAVGLE